MKVSRPLIPSCCLIVISLLIYLVHSSNVSPTNSILSGLSELKKDADQLEREHPGISALKEEITFLRMALTTVKKDMINKKAVHKDIDKLKGEIADIHKILVGIASGSETYSGISVGMNEATEPPLLTEEDIQAVTEEQKANDLKRLTHTNRIFEEENVDQQWSFDMTNRISQVFMDDQLSETDLSSVECHSSLCRLEVLHKDSQSIDQFIHRLPLEVADILPQINYHYDHHEDGSITMVAFLALESYEFPRLEE